MDILNSLYKYLSEADTVRSRELEKFIKNFTSSYRVKFTEQQLITSTLVPTILFPMFKSLKLTNELGTSINDAVSVQEYATSLSFTDVQTIELSDKGFYTIHDVHMNRLGLLKSFSDKAKAYQLIYKVHAVTLFSFTSFQKLQHITVQNSDYKTYETFFKQEVMILIRDYIYDETSTRNKFVVEYCNNNYQVASAMTVQQYLEFNFDTNKSCTFDYKRIQKEKIYATITEIYFCMQNSSEEGWTREPVKKFLSLQAKDNDIKAVFENLYIITKGQLLNLQIKQMFAGNEQTIKLLSDKQEDLKRNRKRDIETLEDNLNKKLYSCIMSRTLLNKTKDFNDLVADLTILCASGKAGGYLGTKADQIKQYSRDFYNRGYLNYRLVYDTEVDGTVKTVSGYEFFNKLADLACIKCLGQEENNKQKRVVVNIKVIDRKIKTYLNSAKGKAVVALLQSMRYRDFLQQELWDKYKINLPYSDWNSSVRNDFETWLKKPVVLSTFPDISLPENRDFMFELVVALNAISFNKNVKGSCDLVNELINQAILRDPLSEDAIQQEFAKPKDSNIKNQLETVMWDFTKKTEELIQSELKKTIPESLQKILQNLQEINQNIGRVMTIQTYVSVGLYLQNVYASNWGAMINQSTSYFTTRFAFGGIIAALGIVLFFMSCFKGGEWDWQRIVYTITGALSALSLIAQILSWIFKSEWLFKASFVLSTICQVILGIVMIVLGVLTIIQGVNLLDEGMTAKGIITITIGVLEIIAGALMILSIAFPPLAAAALVLGLVILVLQIILFFLDDEVTTALKEFKEKYPNLQCWQEEDQQFVFPDDLYVDNNERPIDNATFSYVNLKRRQNSETFKVVIKCQDNQITSAFKRAMGEDFDVKAEIFPRQIQLKYDSDYRELIDSKLFAHFNWVNFSDGKVTYPCLSFGGIPSTSDPQIENRHNHSDTSGRNLTPQNFCWLDFSTGLQGYAFSWRWYQTDQGDFPFLTIE